MRTITEVIDSIRRGLASVNSPLARFSNYSNIYALLRSIAAVITEQDARMDLIDSSNYLYSAVGEALDRKADEVGLIRRLGSRAAGSVIISASSNGTLPARLVLTTGDQLHQVELVEQTAVNSSVEVVASVRSLAVGSIENLSAGTKLFSSIYPGISFTIGRTRLGSVYQGPLTGGADTESDEELRGRIVRRLQTRAQNSPAGLESLILDETPITKLFIRNSFPTPGQAVFFINSRNSQDVAQVRQVIEANKPVGLAYSIRAIQSFPVEVSLIITTLDLTLSSSISSQVRAQVSNLFNALELGQFPNREAIAAVCYRVPGVSQVQVTTPDINLIPPAETLCVLSNLSISING